MSDKASRTYLLPSGAEIEIETLPERRAGAADVAIGRDVRASFDEVIAPLGEVAERLFSTIKSKVREPDSVTLEFAASFKGQAKLLIVSGEGQGSIKVTLGWKKS